MTDPAPQSPCVQLCTLDQMGICIGCFRTIEEIARWTAMSAEEQRRTIEAAERRRLARGAPRSVVNV